MHPVGVPLWKKAPFVRILLPVIIGIVLQWYIQYSIEQIFLAAICFIIAFAAFQLLPLGLRFTFQKPQGILLNIILITLGIFITYQKDIRHDKLWFGKVYHDSNYIVATINEPLQEKNKSYKAEAEVNEILNTAFETTKGKLIIYFEKDSLKNTALKYGDKILFNKNIQPLKNSGNPGAFNYQRYSAFYQIFYNVFLKRNEWVLLKETDVNFFKKFIFNTRKKVIDILQRNISGENEKAIAEALLIGYKTDLDKDLVQAYSNTGVVHIIAISGLHLGLVYIMLLWFLNKIPLLKRSTFTKNALLIICIWMFAILTGGSPSVLRAAVMFSCIIIGSGMKRKSSVYNSLAASAFLLLCYNPFLLWEVGFQLSYLAILGIVTFQKPIYNWLYLKNKFLNKSWQLISVAVAAQVLTFPACLYYFHQFPMLFFITNVIVVPVATLVLYVAIILLIFSPIITAAIYIGKIVTGLIWLMNAAVLFINRLPFNLWDKISASLFSTLILYGIVISTGYWLLNKNKTAFKFSLVFLLWFAALSGYTKWETSNQQKLIVYNVPQHQSIDFINGNTYKFIGDSALLANGMLQNFHLKPGRIAMQLSKKVDSMNVLDVKNIFYLFKDKKILLVDQPIVFEREEQKINVDYIIISKNPKLYIPQLAKVFNCYQYIFDGSNSLWKIAKWKKDCDQLHLRCYSVPEEGAFIKDL